VSEAAPESAVAQAATPGTPAVQEPGGSDGDYFVQDEADVQDEFDEDESGPVSPSQISRDRINAIRSNDFFYQSYGKQDPFLVLVTGKFEQSASKELLDVNSGKLVGVMWGQDDQFALVEDGEGFGYILRVGDRVQNGRIVSIRKNSLTARVTLYGITNQVVLKLENTEG
jgi:hypothetical protein